MHDKKQSHKNLPCLFKNGTAIIFALLAFSKWVSFLPFFQKNDSLLIKKKSKQNTATISRLLFFFFNETNREPHGNNLCSVTSCNYLRYFSITNLIHSYTLFYYCYSYSTTKKSYWSKQEKFSWVPLRAFSTCCFFHQWAPLLLTTPLVWQQAGRHRNTWSHRPFGRCPSTSSLGAPLNCMPKKNRNFIIFTCRQCYLQKLFSRICNA